MKRLPHLMAAPHSKTLSSKRSFERVASSCEPRNTSAAASVSSDLAPGALGPSSGTRRSARARKVSRRGPVKKGGREGWNSLPMKLRPRLEVSLPDREDSRQNETLIQAPRGGPARRGPGAPLAEGSARQIRALICRALVMFGRPVRSKSPRRGKRLPWLPTRALHKQVYGIVAQRFAGMSQHGYCGTG